MYIYQKKQAVGLFDKAGHYLHRNKLGNTSTNADSSLQHKIL